MKKDVNFIAIAKDEKIINKVKSICKEFSFSYEIFESIDEMNAIKEGISTNFLLLSVENIRFRSDFAMKVQECKFYFPDAYITILVDSNIDEETSKFLKKSGANLVMQQNELQTNSKLEYISVQTICSTYIPIKSSDIKLGTKVEFPIFHLMPQNKKFIKVIYPGWDISESKKQKMDRESELYIHRDDSEAFSEYISKNQDLSASGLVSRCRAYYINLEKKFSDLILMLTDQCESPSFQKGKENLDKCKESCNNLLDALAAVSSPWDVVNNSNFGAYGTVDRTPAIIASCGIMALSLGYQNINDILLATLISDIGFVGMPYGVSKKIRDRQIDLLNAEEKEWYENHPIVGLNLALSKKLPIEEKIKSIILNTHERLDKKGFPKQPEPDRIPNESQLIQFAQLLDSKCVIKMGESKKNMEKEKNELIIQLEKEGILSFSLLNNLKGLLAS